MSDFLLNVARRGAGLSPVVRPRAPWPAATDPADDASAAPLEPDSIEPRSPDDPAPTTPSAADLRPSPGGPPPVLVIEAPRPVVSALPPVVSTAPPAIQRAPADPPSAPPVVTGPLPVAGLPPARGEAPDVAPVIAPREVSAAVLEPPIPPAWPPRSVVAGPEVVRIEPAGRPSADGDREPLLEAPGVERDVPPPRGGGSRAPRIAAPTEDLVRIVPAPSSPAPATAAVEPAPPPEVRPSPIASGPERIVHVRIGAIEIHGTPAPSLAAPAPSPPATPPSAGFEEFARLRSHAPWTR
jgi:hypothetical protein